MNKHFGTRTATAVFILRARAVLPAPLYATVQIFCCPRRSGRGRAYCKYNTHRAHLQGYFACFYAYYAYMALIFIRTALIFLTLLICMRLMGKSQIGEMQPFEFVITLLIAELACIPMADSSIPLMYGVVSIITIFILHQTVWLLDLWFRPMKAVICGKPSLVITREGVDARQLRKNNLDVSDLIESMRVAGYFNLDDVYYGLYEANGSFSALARENRTNSLPVLLIDNGRVDKANLAAAGIPPEKLYAFLKERGTTAKRVLVMTADGGGRVYLQKKGRPYTIESMETDRQW